MTFIVVNGGAFEVTDVDGLGNVDGDNIRLRHGRALVHVLVGVVTMRLRRGDSTCSGGDSASDGEKLHPARGLLSMF